MIFFNREDAIKHWEAVRDQLIANQKRRPVSRDYYEDQLQYINEQLAAALQLPLPLEDVPNG